MRTLSIILFFLLFQFSSFCQNFIDIQLDKYLSNEREPLISEIASDISFVKLKTDQDHIIGSIGSISRFYNKLIIVANQGKSIYIFTDKGDFLVDIGQIGKGPGEFLEVYGLSIDPKSGNL